MAPPEQSNLCAGGAGNEDDSEVTDRVADAPIQGRLSEISHRAACRNVGTPSIGGRLRGCHLSRMEADVRHLTDVVGARHFLMLRFWSQGSTPRNAGVKGCPVPILFCGPGPL